MRAFDYIVVGAGSAGCIVASRLTEDPSIRVLLVEAGGSDRHPMISMPGALPFVYQNTRISWGYQSGPEPHLGGRTIDEKQGRVIGGTSSINAMIFNRGNPLDYEGWTEAGLPDWSYAHCLPYFRKMETFVDGEDAWRGGEGPVKISRADAKHKLYDAFLRSGEEAGYVVTPDHNGYRQEGFHVAQSFIHNGVRWSAARAYLEPALQRPNLQLMKTALVTRVVVEHGAAVGIDVAAGGTTETVTCEREVVVCSGAINSPRLLLLSGIGDPDALRKLGIAVRADVREVGRNLQNHPGVDLQFATDDEHSLTSELGRFGRATMALEWALRRKGLGTSNFFETGAFLRTRDDVSFPNMQFEFLPLARRLERGKIVPIPGFQVWMDLSRPESRGAVTLKSADPAEHPSIVFNHLAVRQDVQDLIDGVRLTRSLIDQHAWSPYRRGELTPGEDVASDVDIEAFLRQKTGTSYHAAGTCRMGADDDAVVNTDGRVIAVDCLRVVDASIMPKVVTANLNAPVMMLAEKLADRIRGVEPLPSSAAPFYRDDRGSK
jgi:choline dehydrogenase